MTELLQHLVNGVSLGAIYALIALGYTMVYGVLQLVNFAHGDVLMIVLQRIAFHPRMATAMRAVSWNANVGALMGINVDVVISFTFVLGSVLAAVAGILYSSKYPSVHPLMGLMPGLKAFVAAVLGGIGNVPGAMLGGLLLGLAEQLVSGYTSSSSPAARAVAILILILLIKPSGLLGKGASEKV